MTALQREDPGSPGHQSADTRGAALSDEGTLHLRGRTLRLSRLVDPRLHDPAHRALLRSRLVAAKPFAHLSVDGWFDVQLLELVAEEFVSPRTGGWRSLDNRFETLHRQRAGTALGPASTLYFGIVNSGWFTSLLSEITGVADLLPDPRLHGGGLHETRAGGRFGIHRDFDVHERTGLRNEMVLITYLNRDWRPEWDGALELWDLSTARAMVSIEPEMGRTVLLRNGPGSLHGHPRPLAAPPGRMRRSVASYYYTNPMAQTLRERRVSSVFLANGLRPYRAPLERAMRLTKDCTPPLLWRAMQRFKPRR